MIQNLDKLNFDIKAKNYIKYYLCNNNWNLKSWMNFITWYWWSWKTTFIEHIISQLRNKDNTFLNWRTLIHIKFNPWNLQSTKNIYQNFFDVFVNSLIKEKYDSSLKSQINTLINLLANSWNSLLKIISTILNRELLNIDDIIAEINKSLSTTYKDYVILITIDEIDRVNKDDLINIWKVLNIIKLLVDLQEKDEKNNDNLLCLYAADTHHLSSFLLWDNPKEKSHTNFYLYYNKFPNTKYDVYWENIIDIQKDMIKYFKNHTFYDPKILESKNSSEEILQQCDVLQNELEELGKPIVIRDATNLIHNFNLSLNRNIDKLVDIFYKSIYKDVILKNNIKWYINWIIKNNFDLFFDYIYINSVNERDNSLMRKLDSLYNEITIISFDDDHEKNINDKVNEIINDWYSFKYKLKPFEDKSINEIIIWLAQWNYLIVKALISKVVEPRINIIINTFETDITNNLCKYKSTEINNLENIIKILFIPRMWRNLSRNHFTEIHNNLLNNQYNLEENINFFKNSIDIFKKYISTINAYYREEIDNSDTWFIITMLTYFHLFIKHIQFEIFNNNWSIKQWMYNELNIIITKIEELISFCEMQFEKWSKMRFFFLYFYIRLIRYWIYIVENDERNNNAFSHIFREILIKSDNNRNTQHQNLSLGDYARKIELDLIKNELEIVNNDLVKYTTEFFTVIKYNWNIVAETLKVIETIIYALFYKNQGSEENEIKDFIDKYICRTDEKYKFLLLCNSLIYNLHYKENSESRIDFKSLRNVYKTIYHELCVNWDLDKLFDNYYDEINIYYEDLEHNTKEQPLNKLVESKTIWSKNSAKKLIFSILDYFYKDDIATS